MLLHTTAGTYRKLLILFSMLVQVLAVLSVFVLCLAQKENEKQTSKRGLQGFGYGHEEQYADHTSLQGHHQFFGGEEHHDYYPEARIKSITIHKEVKIPVPHPYPVKVEKKIPYPVIVPYEVKVEKPVPVHVEKPYPVYVEKKVPYPVEKKVPYPPKVEVKVPVPVPHTVQITKPYPVKVPVPKPYPIKIPVYIEKKIPVYIKKHAEDYEIQKHEEKQKYEKHHGFESIDFDSLDSHYLSHNFGHYQHA
jgi:hypothetical protein